MAEKFNITKCLLIMAICIMSLPPRIMAITEPKIDVELTQQEAKKPQIVTKISFEDILTKAKEHSYDLKIADYNVLISKQGVRGARSEYFPKLNFSAGTEYTRNFRDVNETTVMSIGDAFINPYTRYQSILGINVGYNLFDFGVRGGNLKAAKEDIAIKELEAKEKLQELNLTLLDSYTKILITSKQIELNKQILAIEEKNLNMKERLFNAKEISKIELNDEKVKVSSIKNKISELKNIESESLNWLSFYTGEQYDMDNLKVSELKKCNYDVLSFNDYTKSITWKIHEKNIKKKEFELQVAKRTNYPKVNVYGRYYLYGSDHQNYGKSLGIEPSNFSVGASLNMPIFDGFKNSANIEKTALELKQLHVERDKAIAQLMARLASMRSNLIFLDEQINANNDALKELTNKEKSIHKLASKRLISPIEENDAKTELLNQQIELDKNSITQIAITRGIQILTEEY
ncbi:TolC family protein [bacterium]|nr:TolC family protein [bacterium]